MTYPPAPEQPHQPEPAPRRRPRLAWLLVAALAVTMAAGGSYGAWKRFGPDPGINACKAMAEDRSPATGEKTGDDEWSEDEYLQMREVFADSRHDDIHDAGVKFVDLAWQMIQASDGGDDGALGAALLYAGPATSAMSELAGACANHGIVVKFDAE